VAESLQQRAAVAALWLARGGVGVFLWQLHDKLEMWKKVNLADPKNLAAVAGQRHQILAEKGKRKKNVHSTIWRCQTENLGWPSFAKKGKKQLKIKLQQAPIRNTILTMDSV
jgi:hypothetical protein